MAHTDEEYDRYKDECIARGQDFRRAASTRPTYRDIIKTVKAYSGNNVTTTEVKVEDHID